MCTAGTGWIRSLINFLIYPTISYLFPPIFPERANNRMMQERVERQSVMRKEKKKEEIEIRQESANVSHRAPC